MIETEALVWRMYRTGALAGASAAMAFVTGIAHLFWVAGGLVVVLCLSARYAWKITAK